MSYFNTISWHVAGLGSVASGGNGTLTFAAYDSTGTVKVAASSNYLTEAPAGSGEYLIDVPALDAAAGDYGVVTDGTAGPGHTVTFALLDAGTGGTVGEVTVGSSSRTINVVHKIDGVLTDFDSIPVLRDPTLAYGVKHDSDGAVVVAANTPFTHDGTGIYSYVVTGLTAGENYTAYVERVYLGETKRSSVQWTAGTTAAEGYYAKRAKMLLRAGLNNLASYSNLDSDTTTLDETNLQAAMNWADGYVDTRARVLLLTADTGASPHMLLTTNTFFDRVSDLASDIAVAYLYSARGFTGDTQQTVEGQMADMDAKARKELDEILDAARITQAQDAGTNGAEVITVGGCASARCNVVLPVWGWW